MSRGFIIAGTDTGVGKTVFAAALTGALDADYWKPIQCGLEDGGDRARVAALSGLDENRILPEVYRLGLAASPHIAAAAEGVTIDPAKLALPPHGHRPLVVECAGGLLVPLTDDLLQVEVVADWELPVVLVARTALGTINHSLLSLEALRRRAVPVHGIAFVGASNDHVEATIARLGHVRRLGRLDRIDPLDPARLAAAFRSGFSLADFTL